jgi:DNA-binding transcriptional LysR family regulator
LIDSISGANVGKVKADDIFLFVQVVEAGSFAKVAQQLEITNSVVSKRIGRLESALNMQLLYRTTRKLSLTDGGRTLYEKAKLAKVALQDAQDAVTGYSDNLSGTIRLSVPSVSASVLINQALAEFTQQYPDINIDLVVADHFVDMLEEGFDLAIRTGELADSSLIARRLVDSDWVLVASPEYLRHNGVPQHSRQLQYHNCLTYKYESSGADTWRLAVNGIDYYERVSGNFQANNLLSLKTAVLSGVGIAYLPKVAVHEELNAQSLVELLPDYETKQVGIFAVYPNMRQPDQKLKLLIEHLRDMYQQHQHWFIRQKKS